MLVILGKTASGKDTVVNKLVSEHGFKKLVAYTTRPIRDKEEDGVTYHYISEEDFKHKIKNGFFAEWKTYITEFGVWYYGTSLKDLENAKNNTILILSPSGYREITKNKNINIKSIYLYANNATIKRRLCERGDDENEAERRIKNDNEDFKYIQTEVDRIVYNNFDTNVKDVINNILNFWRVIMDKEVTIYLAEKMSGLSFEEMNRWRCLLQNMIEGYSKVTDGKVNVINPSTYYNFEHIRHKSELEVMKFDLKKLVSSDIVVVNIDGLNTSIGTCIECYEAYKQDIPVIAFGSKNDFNNLHPWLQICITRYEDNYINVANYIRDFYMT